MIEIRDFDDADWLSIYPFFRSIVAAGATYAYPEGLSSEQARAYWVSPPPSRTVVAGEEGEIVGSAQMGPNRPGRGSHIATASFMVDPQHQGRGTGRALGEEVVRWARAAGYRGIQFNAVVATNHAAVHLWTSLGFQILGTVPQAFLHQEHGYVGLHLMYLQLV
jgi:L-amino acid N-acyltransferase YncA